MSCHHINLFISNQDLAGHTAKTRQRRRESLDFLTRHAGVPCLLEVTRDDVEYWLAGRQAPATRRAYLFDARMFFRWSIERGHTDSDPTHGIPVPRVPQRMANPLSQRDVMRLRSAVIHEPERRLIIELALMAGMRVGEIARLDHSDVDHRPAHRAIMIRESKGGKSRSVPLADHLSAMIGDGRGPVVSIDDPRGVSERIRTAFRRVGITGHRPHDLRATYADELYRKMRDIKLVAQVLGHSTPTTTMAYLRPLDLDASILDGLYTDAA